VSTTLYVSNLPSSATEELLTGKFGKFGAVIAVTLDRDTRTGASRRGAFVEMGTAAGAQGAINGLHLADFDGRLVSVYKALAGAVAH
jgi:RNA recognition motif-containing protein